MSLTQRFVMGMATGAGSILFKTALNVLLVPIMLHSLGAEAFSLYILLIGLVELSLLLDLGLTEALTRQLAAHQDDPQETASLFKIGHSLFGVMGLVFFAGGLLLLPFFNQLFHIPVNLQTLTQTALLLILLEGAVTIYSSYYRATLLSRCWHQWSNLADALFHASTGITVILLLSGFDLLSVLYVRLAAAIVRLGVMLVQAWRMDNRVCRPQAKFHFGKFKELAGWAFYAMMINLSIIISHKIDVFVIALFLPLGTIATYEVVFRFLGIALQIAMKLSEGLFPLFSRMSARNETAASRQLFLRMSGFLNVVVSTMLMLIAVFYGELFSLFSAGKIEMPQTWPILLAVMPFIWSGALQMPANYYLFTSGRQKYLTVSSITAAVANLTLSLALVKPFGMLGVALGTLIPQLLQHQASLIREACRSLKIGFKEYVTTVHLPVLMPLAIGFGWIKLTSPLLGLGWHPLVPLGLIASSTLTIGLLTWGLIHASAMEKEWFTLTIVQPARTKWMTLMKKPQVLPGSQNA